MHILIIPVYNPDEHLLKLAEVLNPAMFSYILVVDDGSTRNRQVFQQLQAFPSVRILYHEKNLGKGAAIKTGLKYALAAYSQCQGITVADADGQHLASDIVQVAKMLSAWPNALVLGTRTNLKRAPLRNRLGNALIGVLFYLLTGCRLVDSQTGLRSFGPAVAHDFLSIAANGYDFEMAMLVRSIQIQLPIQECPIETVYQTGVYQSRFKPFHDSWQVCKALFQSK